MTTTTPTSRSAKAGEVLTPAPGCVGVLVFSVAAPAGAGAATSYHIFGPAGYRVETGLVSATYHQVPIGGTLSLTTGTTVMPSQVAITNLDGTNIHVSNSLAELLARIPWFGSWIASLLGVGMDTVR